jgi:hypothetical protein
VGSSASSALSLPHAATGERSTLTARHKLWYRPHFSGLLSPPCRRATQLRFHELRHNASLSIGARAARPKVIQTHLRRNTIPITLDRHGHLFPPFQEALANQLDAIYEARRVEQSNTWRSSGCCPLTSPSWAFRLPPFLRTFGRSRFPSVRRVPVRLIRSVLSRSCRARARPFEGQVARRRVHSTRPKETGGDGEKDCNRKIEHSDLGR